MRPKDWRRVTEVAAAAIELEGAARDAYLDDACAGTSWLRTEVESLLGAHDRAGTFIETPAVVSLPDADTELDDLTIDQQLGPYLIVDIIGRGGMGTVYRARRVDHEFEQQVA